MSLSGIRDISLIRTPPVNRLPIRTFISKREDALITKAIEFELSRGGQVFFLHNRVQSIHQTAKHLQDLVPRAKITVAHGQMEEGELEMAITEFYEKRSNVLVCTSIIESGIDLPSANTILIDRADAFGLAQLYQIRGRVGRGDQRGYAYLLVPPESVISSDAKKRLDVIQRFVELGSGFQVASHDLEIRGGGELLGPQQSGNIQAVGFDLYLELLEQAVQELRAEDSERKEEQSKDPEIKAPFPAFLAEDYVPDVHQRLSLYRKLSGCSDDQQVDALEEELRDRFGRLPDEAVNLLWLIRTKVHLRRLGIDAITVGKEKLVLVPGQGSSLDPVQAIALVSAHPSRYQLTPDSRFVASRAVRSMKELYFSIQELLRDLSPAARGH
jgi:transcription-repair coupling factor (superfamily II helicase)